MEEPIFKPVSASMKKTAWGSLKEVADNIDFISRRMSAAKRQERADEINRYLTRVVRSPSYVPSKDSPKPPLTDAIIDQAIAYAQTLMGETPGSLKSLIKDPRKEPTL